MVERLLLASLCIFLNNQCLGAESYNRAIKVGASQTNQYFPLLKNKRIGVITNHTGCVDNEHIVDLLLKNGFIINKIFTPEHGFRGEADAGEHQKNCIDSKTGIPLISLYGKQKKPLNNDLCDIDIFVFDIQDVGVRFYTYISTLQYCMEAAAENNKPFIILDRPNPNGFYVDGPVCDISCRSFVGMQPVPIVYGMTIGEYAMMLNGEGWLSAQQKCDLTVIKCTNYSHKDLYELPIPPSPNLKTMQAVYLYPSLCLFEGTPISVGRGTSIPFEVFGHPKFPKTSFSFTPQSMTGAQKPPYLNQSCSGFNLHDDANVILEKLNNNINLFWLKQAHEMYPDKKRFFNKFFDNLTGNTVLKEQIQMRCDEKDIRQTWQQDLKLFKKIRKNYLLYND
jgi:uncharacterized protein YbbC (DUF1343 family)